jgi:hypothetical protein
MVFFDGKQGNRSEAQKEDAEEAKGGSAGPVRANRE